MHLQQSLRRKFTVAQCTFLQNGIMFGRNMSIQISRIDEFRIANVAVIQIVNDFVMLISSMKAQRSYGIKTHVAVVTLMNRIENAFVVLQVLQQIAPVKSKIVSQTPYQG